MAAENIDKKDKKVRFLFSEMVFCNFGVYSSSTMNFRLGINKMIRNQFIGADKKKVLFV